MKKTWSEDSVPVDLRAGDFSLGSNITALQQVRCSRTWMYSARRTAKPANGTGLEKRWSYT